MQGIGIENYQEGGSYDGNFYSNVKHGVGAFSDKTGYNYTGEWRFGVKQGVGLEYFVPIGLQLND